MNPKLEAILLLMETGEPDDSVRASLDDLSMCQQVRAEP